MIDCSKATPDEKENLFGREFRELHILSVEFTSTSTVMTILLEAQKVTLVGDPQEALRTYMAATFESVAQ